MRRPFVAVALILACFVGGCGSLSPTHSTTPVTRSQAGVSQSAGGSVHPAGWGRPAPPSYRLAPTLVPTMVMFDSVNLAELPTTTQAAAGYTSGFWPTFTTLRARFPKAHAISIAINVLHYAQCLDVEPGDAAPGQVPDWVRREEIIGYHHPCVYSSWWEFTHQVIPVLVAAHIARSSVFEWDADYTNIPHLDAGFDATQWTSRALGRNLDESIASLSFLSAALPPYVAPKPKPAPKPAPRPTPKPTPKPHPAKVICWGKHAHPHSKACKPIIRRHSWLISRRRYWQHVRVTHHCLRLTKRQVARNRTCDVALGLYALYRGDAVRLRKEHS